MEGGRGGGGDIWPLILTLRRDRGVVPPPPLEKDGRVAKNGAPQARQLPAQLLKFNYRLFGAMRHLPPATGGPVPPCRRNAAKEDLRRF